MCKRGTWRGFHTRYLKTPSDVESPLVVMEQCTECGSYRARNMDDVAYVDPGQNSEKESQRDLDLDDPRDESGGSVWGPDSSKSGNDDGW